MSSLLTLLSLSLRLNKIKRTLEFNDPIESEEEDFDHGDEEDLCLVDLSNEFKTRYHDRQCCLNPDNKMNSRKAARC